MHDLVQSSKYDFTILESYGTCQAVEALQLLLMVMLGSRNSSKPPELSEIWFFLHNPSLCMVSLNENFFLKNVWYFGYDLSNFQYYTSDYIQYFFLFIHLHANLWHQVGFGICVSHRVMEL